MFQGEIDMERYFQGRILKAFSEIIIVIIEAKKDIEYQSNYGQIISELYNSHLYNKSNIENVYGILTTGENWQWWKYNGTTFHASTKFIELRKQNHKSLPIVTSLVYSIIINAWIESCKIYLKDDYEEFDQCKDEISKAKTNSKSI
jgi:hypothetical protein